MADENTVQALVRAFRELAETDLPELDSDSGQAENYLYRFIEKIRELAYDIPDENAEESKNPPGYEEPDGRSPDLTGEVTELRGRLDDLEEHFAGGKEQSGEQEIAKLQATINSGSSGNVKLCDIMSGVLTEYGDAFSAMNIGPSTAPSGAYVLLQRSDQNTMVFQYAAAGSGTIGPNTGVISSQTPVAGAAGTVKATDAADGLKLFKTPADGAVVAENNYATVEFVVGGAGLRAKLGSALGSASTGIGVRTGDGLTIYNPGVPTDNKLVVVLANPALDYPALGFTLSGELKVLIKEVAGVQQGISKDTNGLFALVDDSTIKINPTTGALYAIGGGGGSLADNTGVISSETPAVGAAATGKRSDAADGVKLRKNITPAAISGMHFGSASSGLQNQIAGAADEDAERAATANKDTDNSTVRATLEVVPGALPNGGEQVKLMKSFSTGDEQKAKLQAGASGLYVPLNDDGLQNASGKIALPTGTAGQMLYHNGTRWVVVAAGSEGQFLKFVSGVPTWSAAPTAKWKANA